jgi:uncharacterized protein
MSQPQTPLLWGDKPYHTWNFHLRQVFGEKIFKIPLDVGFTCPNRDGTIGHGGCIYCSAKGAGDYAGSRQIRIDEQFVQIKAMMHKKWPKAKYLAYFQAYTNTYAPVEELRDMYHQALAQEDVVGLSISTRPDCLNDNILDLLGELNEQTYLWVELGLQSSHDRTLKLINRGHDYQCFLDAVTKLRARNIMVCVHIILGLPGETKEDMLETAKAVANLPIQGVKLHLLHLMKDTPMVNLYEAGELAFMSQEEYTSLVVDILEILPPEIVIHRLTGDSPRETLIGPLWSLKKWEVLNGIDKELKDRNTWQGRLAD